MKNKNIIAVLLSFLCLLPLYSQDYYWYKDKQIELQIDSTKLNLTLTKKQGKIELNLLESLDEYSTSLKLNQLEETDNYKLFSIELESSQMYNDIVTLLKSNSNIIAVSPYFIREEGSSIGTSSFFYVQLHDLDDYEKLKQFAEKMNLDIVKQVPNIPDWYILSVTSNSKFNSVEASNITYESGLFAAVDPAFMFNFKTNCTNDPQFSILWGLNNTSNSSIDINACDAWAITRGAGVNVAVLDQGIDPNHNDLKANFHSLSFDAQSGTSPSVFISWYTHGTHVAGTIAAVKDNNLQVVGVTPESKIMRVSHDLYPSNTLSAELASGISWAWQNGADVINNSWGDQGGQLYGQMHSAILENAIVNAMTQGRTGKGCVVVFASGNWRVIDYPTYFHSDILCVGAVDEYGARSVFNSFQSSGYGSQLDVVAPGSAIYSTVPNNGIDSDNGTSMAAPHVAGVAALVLSVNPNLTQKQVADIIESTAQKVGNYNYTNSTAHPNGKWHEEMGYGLVDAHKAVQKAICSLPSTTLSKVITTDETINSSKLQIYNTTVKQNQKLTANACEEVNINANFTVERGAEFEINITP